MTFQTQVCLLYRKHQTLNKLLNDERSLCAFSIFATNNISIDARVCRHIYEQLHTYFFRFSFVADRLF